MIYITCPSQDGIYNYTCVCLSNIYVDECIFDMDGCEHLEPLAATPKSSLGKVCTYMCMYTECFRDCVCVCVCVLEQ